MDSLQVAAAEANSTGKQDSPRTIMIKANLKKASLKVFHQHARVLGFVMVGCNRRLLDCEIGCLLHQQ